MWRQGALQLAGNLLLYSELELQLALSALLSVLPGVFPSAATTACDSSAGRAQKHVGNKLPPQRSAKQIAL